MPLVNDIKWLQTLMQKISEDDDSREIELIAGIDQQKFAVHRLIMMSASNYFRALLGPHFKEGKERVAIIADVDGVTLKSVIDYCYTGNIYISDENIESIIAAASRLEMTGIETICMEYCIENLACENVVQTLISADKYSLQSLRQASYYILREDFEHVHASNIQKLEYRLLVELLEFDDIFATEEDICRKLIQWVEYDKANRSKFAPELLKFIRLKHVTIPFLRDVGENFWGEHNSLEMLLHEFEYERNRSDDDTGLSRCSEYPLYDIHLISHEKSPSNTINVDKYNVIVDQWESFLHFKLSSERKNFGLIFDENKILIFGGMVDGNYVKTIDEFNCKSVEYMSNKYEMSTSRGLFTPFKTWGYVYIIGGWNGRIAKNTCERMHNGEIYNQKSMNQSRFSYAIAELRGNIYVAGGKGDHDSNLSSVERYDVLKNDWFMVCRMTYPRHNFTLVATVMTGRYLYAVGCERVIERYDPDQDLWTVIGRFDDVETISRACLMTNEIYAIMGNNKFVKFRPDQEYLPIQLRQIQHSYDNILLCSSIRRTRVKDPCTIADENFDDSD